MRKEEEERKKDREKVPKIQFPANLPANNSETVVSFLDTITRSHAYKNSLFQRKSNSSEEPDGNSDVFHESSENETDSLESKTDSREIIKVIPEEKPENETEVAVSVTPTVKKFNVSIVKENNLSVNDTPM